MYTIVFIVYDTFKLSQSQERKSINWMPRFGNCSRYINERTYYRKFLYEKGNIECLEKEATKGFGLNGVDRFMHRNRYFTESGIIGSKVFVDRIYQEFKDYFSSKHEKKPKIIKGLEGVYSLKRLSEMV